MNIEHNVAKPHRSKWGFIKDIEIGESFIIEKRLRHGVHTYVNRHGIKVEMSGIGLENEMRVWRVK